MVFDTTGEVILPIIEQKITPRDNKEKKIPTPSALGLVSYDDSKKKLADMLKLLNDKL